MLFALAQAQPAAAQDLQDRQASPPPPAETAAPADPDQVQFSAATLEYDQDADTVTASGDVRMYRQGDKLRADQVVWNRKTGKVVATGNIAVTNPQGDVAYGDKIELTDSLKDGVVDNMLVVLDQGGRLAAVKGVRDKDGVITLRQAAYTPCAVTNSSGCPKNPSWKITAVKVVYRPDRKRIYYTGARFNLFGFATIPLPKLSNPVGDGADSGLLSPDIRYSRTNGFEVALPYYFRLAPNRGLTVTPHVYTSVAPMAQAQYEALTGNGAYKVTGYATVSPRSDFLATTPTSTKSAFRGYLDGVARFQFDPYWSLSSSIRLTTDRTFLRRYDISSDDRLRSTVSLERIDPNTYFGVTGWFVQTLRLGDRQGLQPIALPEIDYRRRIDDVLAGRLQLQVNTLGITRTSGQDTQRAFASAQWDLRRITPWGQEVTLTAYARGDVYNASDTVATTVASYRGESGVHARAIGALALDIKWPLIGEFLGGMQRLTPRFQIVASPPTRNLLVPNEDARAVDLEDSNLFALNRFPGYDRWEDSTRFTIGVDYALDLPGIAINATIGESYRLSSKPTIFPDGTGLTDRWSDIVGRTEVRIRDFVSVVHRYRLDKDNFAIRRNEIDATVGTKRTYILLGYLRLNRNISTTLEDLRDREEARVGARVGFARFWSIFGSATVDLTDRNEDPLSISDGFDPVRHRLGVQYEDDCLRLGLTWRRDYQTTGDARRGNSFLLTLAFKNLGR
ncbi:LPS-assembly protein LptD [Sphingomonas sp.]|jgi:LPS-assembly protein|uniref:LPS-assembly protein LptD n=1 Tax=Sphingomonas sp. TaxID=28214 RepID=UPI002E34F532|nr:LPS assembly protein LptD [Sphingomonas sp.]HEX4693725.1 LPS assembly protein LptD [Sphingomonas sp.]